MQCSGAILGHKRSGSNTCAVLHVPLARNDSSPRCCRGIVGLCRAVHPGYTCDLTHASNRFSTSSACSSIEYSLRCLHKGAHVVSWSTNAQSNFGCNEQRVTPSHFMHAQLCKLREIVAINSTGQSNAGAQRCLVPKQSPPGHVRSVHVSALSFH